MLVKGCDKDTMKRWREIIYTTPPDGTLGGIKSLQKVN